MTDFGDALYIALTGRPPTTADMGFPVLLAELVHRTGSGAAAARALGVSPTTFYRWRGGRQTPRTGAGAVARAIRRASLSPDLEADIRAQRKTMRITGTVVVSSDRRRGRTIDLRNARPPIPTRKIANIVNSWLAADDARAERLSYRVIDQHYVEGMDFDSIEEIEFR